MIISPFTPLFFGSSRSDGIESRYVQTFAKSDHILLEVFADPSETVSASIIDIYAGTAYELVCNSCLYNPTGKIVFTEISGLPNGLYMVEVGAKKSREFRVTDDEAELASTMLIQYSMADNRSRNDAMFRIDGMRYFFDFRIPGGFKDSGWSFGIDNEQFVTAEGDIVELYALESTQKTLTLGGPDGVGIVFAELLNRILTCTYVYLDGVRYARKESSVPEMSVQIEGLDSFVFSQRLQMVGNLNPAIENENHVIMRRVDATDIRFVTSNQPLILK